MIRAWTLALFVLMGCAQRRDMRVEAVASPTLGADVTPTVDDDRIVPGHAVGSHVSAHVMFWGLWLPVGFCLALAAIGTALHRRRARRELEATGDAPLRNGDAVIRGRVESDGGDAITVTITQRKKVVTSKNRTYTQWNEKRRDVAARPFRVVTEQGRTVQVIPDARVDLRDALEAPQQVDLTTRRRLVRLRPGERVWVSGVLSGVSATQGAGAYREAQQAPVMRRGLARLIVSTEAPGTYHQERAKTYRGWFRGLLITLAVTHGTLLLDVTAQTLSGRTVHVNVSRAVSWQEWVKPKNGAGRWVPHCALRGAAAGESDEREYEVSCVFHQCALNGLCRTLPTQRALLTAGLLRDVGRGPTLHFAQLGILVLIGWGALIGYFANTASSRPWYAGGKVNDGP